MPLITVGRIVHYTAYNGACLAALVINIPDPEGRPALVDLAVFSAMNNAAGQKNFGLQFHQNVDISLMSAHPGTWHWPERDGQ